MRYYEISENALAEGRTSESGVFLQLPYSDRPRGFKVLLPAGDPALAVLIDYAADRQEETRDIRTGRVTLKVGRHSRRLFAALLDLSGVTATSHPDAVAAVARELTSDLSNAFQQLQERTEVLVPKMNYAVTRRGLDLNGAPPAWLIEAMKQHIRNHPW